MVTLKDEAKDGFYPLYVNDGDTVKGEIIYGKVVFEGDNTAHIFAKLESGLSIEPLPIKLSIHKGTYKGYDYKTRKMVDKQAYEVESIIFDQLKSENFPVDGFTAKFLHSPDPKHYEKIQPFTAIQAVETGDLPELPDVSANGGRQYSDAGKNQEKVILARQSFLIAQVKSYLSTIGVECESVQSASDLFLLLQEKELEPYKEQIGSLINFLMKLIA